MVKIQGPGIARRAPRLVRSGGDVGEIGNIAGVLGRALEERQVERRRQTEEARSAADAVEAGRLTTQFLLAQGRALDEAGAGYDGSAPGFYDGEMSRYDTAMGEFLSAAPEHLRGRLAERLEGQARLRHGLAASELEFQSTRRHALAGAARHVEEAQNAILADSAGYSEAIDSLVEIASGLPADLRDAYLDESRERLTSAYVSARVDEDPAALLEELDRGDLNQVIDATANERYRRAAQTELDRRAREAERRQSERRMLTLISQGSLADDNVASIAATGRELDGFEEADYLAALTAASPAQAASYQSRLEAARSIYGAVGDVRDLTGAQMSERLNELRPAPGVAGFENHQAAYELAQRTFAEHSRARAQDPVGYVQDAETVQQARSAMLEASELEDPEAAVTARQAYADAIWAEQARLEIPAHARRVYSQGEASAIVTSIEEASPQERAQVMRDTINGLSAWGDYRARALDELRDEGLDPVSSIIADLPGDPAAQTRIVMASQNKDALEDSVSSRDRTQLRARIASELEPLTRGFAYSPGGLEVRASMEEAAYLHALGAMSTGSNRDQAARAAASVFRAQYVVNNEYRIPRAIAERVEIVSRPESLRFQGPHTPRLPEQYEVSTERLVVLGAEAALNSYAAEDGVRLFPIEGVGLAPLEASQATADAIQFNGRWITSADESGLMLVVAPDGVPTPVQDSAEAAIMLSWEDLAEIGRAAIEGRSEIGALDAVILRQRGHEEGETFAMPRTRGRN